MWPFSRKQSILESGILQGWTDWHSHILPGVDDGFRNLDSSLRALSFYEQTGIRDLWLTPHIMEDMPNTTADLRKRFEDLGEAYKGSVRLHLAAENMMDNLFEERLLQNDLLPLGKKGDHILVETSYFNPPIGFYGLLDKIKEKGYRPVLAHPERYVYMNLEDYHRIRSLGVKFQLNLPSLAGGYGKEVQKKAFRLLNEGMYDLSGSDIHRLSVFRVVVETKNLDNAMVECLKKLCL